MCDLEQEIAEQFQLVNLRNFYGRTLENVPSVVRFRAQTTCNDLSIFGQSSEIVGPRSDCELA